MFEVRQLSKDDYKLMQHVFKCHEHTCPIDYASLGVAHVKYINFGGEVLIGEIIVHQKIIQHIINIFKILYENEFPIAKILPAHHYNNDEESMLDNNTSGYFCRYIADSNKFSTHAFGLAIDINPLQNPYILNNNPSNGQIKIYPKSANLFVNRNILLPGMVENKLKNQNITIVELFKQYGFQWGGDWSYPVDYHHFQFQDI
jgi:hypothetical protein